MNPAMASRGASADGDITRLLQLWRGGDNGALADLFHKMYPELRKVAGMRMKLERPEHTIQPTALIGEVYIRLVDSSAMKWENRAHFLAVASRVMRNFLVDYARSRASHRGGCSSPRLDLTGLHLPSDVNLAGTIEVNDLLDRLATFDARAAQVFEMRFFGGLTHEEAAAVLGYTEQTMKRDWRTARAWLIAQLRKAPNDDAGTMAAG